MLVINIFLAVLAIYFGIGVLFGLLVLFTGGSKIDPILKQNSWKLRLLLLPGLVATWPFLILRIFKTTKA